MPHPTLPTGPTRQGDRYEILDVLRGFALLGVLIANLVELGGEGVLATADQLAALPSAAMDEQTNWLLNLFIFDKANTLFAILFGAGFWIMLERLSARGAAFEQIYLRRIALLTALGFLHLLGWFAWDILHVYGLMAFVLLLSRKMPARTMFWAGLLLMIFARPMIEWFIGQSASLSAQMDLAYTDAAVLGRQSAVLSGDFFAWVGAMDKMTVQDWFLSGTMVAWFTYALGRFYIGAWIVRQGWIQTAENRLSFAGALIIPLLIFGFGLEGAALLLQDGPAGTWGASSSLLVEVMHAVATPLIAAGYVCGLTLLFFGRGTSWLVRPFAPVGQMALTNYLLQSPFIILTLGGFGPGLGLAGHAGSTTYTLFALGFFATQIVFSHIWLQVFRYGPAEWVWRALTYGTWPALRRSVQQPV